jgi:sterol 3beta-glucosyltransferase
LKITILTYGSRGDVQPFVALALGLQRAGHFVRLAAPGRFAAFCAQHAVPFAPLAGDPEVISQRLNDAGRNAWKTVRGISDYIFSIAPEVARGALAACEDADLIVHSFLFTSGGHAFARARGIPDVSVQTFPMFAPTRAFPNVALAHLPPGWRSYLSHWLGTQIFWRFGNLGYRRLLGGAKDMPPLELRWPFAGPGPQRTPLLFAFSPVIVPRPIEWNDPSIHIPGYFFLDTPESYQPPQELVDFLADGDAPVCVTFGSMVNAGSARIDAAVREALALTNNRAVILTGWRGSQPEAAAPNLFSMEAAPHDWLFPRCKLVIHHGGAGTTAAGLRAGVPAVILPHAADQPFWGKRIADAGAGPQPLEIKRLSAEGLAEAIRQAQAQTMRARAAEMGSLIRAENGVGQAVRIIEHRSEQAVSNR